MSRPETIAVVGLWHLGSVVAASWAELGHTVRGFDPSRDVVAGLQTGQPPIFEPRLAEAIRANLGRGRLSFTHDLREAVTGADVVFVAFDTPVDAHDRSDLTPLQQTLEAMAPLLTARAVVIVSSQVPVGTCARWRDFLRRAAPDRGLDLAYSPENLRLGEALECYLRPDRIVLGADDETTRERVIRLFAPMGAPVLSMSLASAEMAKHALNSFLATSISFINEIASLCEAAGADVLAVVEALKTDPRVGQRAFLSPGLGFAGGTLARDVRVLEEIGHAATPLLDAVLEVNRRRPGLVVRRLAEALGKLDGLTIGVLGLTYKPGTSTLRRSVALEVIDHLVAAGAVVKAFDPKADLSELEGPPSFEPVADPYQVAAGASALIVITEWPEFAALDFSRVKSLMASPVIVDAKNLLAGLRLADSGFTYLGVGR